MDTLTLLIVAGAACFLWEWWRRKVLSPHQEEHAEPTEDIDQVIAKIQEWQQQLSAAANRNDYAEAIIIGERMLALSDTYFGDDPEVILPLLTALSNFHHLSDQPRGAMPYLLRSIPLRESFPALHADQADSFSQLADLHLQLGAPREALPLIRREVELRRRYEMPDEALLRAQCKLLSLMLDEPAMAAPLRRDIIATAQKLGQEIVTNLANEANRAVNDALHTGRVRDAWAAAEHAALLTTVAQQGPDDEIIFVCRSNLAEMLRRNRCFEEAETQFLQLIADLGKRNNNIEGLRIAYNNLALLYDDCGRTSDAVSWRERQMALLQGAEVNTGSRFNALNNLAVSQSNQGDNNTATQTYAEALALSPDGDGVDPRLWAETLNNYGITLINLGRLSEAGRLYKKVIERKKAGADIPMPAVASSFNGLGILSDQLGKLAQAQDMFERALAIKEKHLPNDHLSLETARHNLGSVYAQQGDAARATQMAQQVLASREKRLGSDHPETQSARNNLAAMTTAFEPVATLPESATREDVDALMVKTTGGELLRYATYNFGRTRDTSVSSVLIPETQAVTLHRKLTNALPRSWQCFIGSTRWLGEEKHDGMAELVTIQSVSQFDCLRVARTDAVNHELDTEEIIRTLQDYDRRFGIRIYNASTDTVGFMLVHIPEDLDAFAQELLDFCMDLEDVELIKQMITASDNRVELWWD